LRKERILKNYIVANWDFDVLLKAARAVQDHCGYEFDGFNRGIEGFEKEFHLIYIALEEATRLLNSCTVDTVVYGSPGSGWKDTTGIASGIQLWSKEEPWQIWVQEDLKAETLTISRKQKRSVPIWKSLGHDLLLDQLVPSGAPHSTLRVRSPGYADRTLTYLSLLPGFSFKSRKME